jgi:hypothetical protein
VVTRPAVPAWVWHLGPAVIRAVAAVAAREQWGTVEWTDPETALASLSALAAQGAHPTVGWWQRHPGQVIPGPTAESLLAVAAATRCPDLVLASDAFAPLIAAVRCGRPPALGWWIRAGYGRRAP